MAKTKQVAILGSKAIIFRNKYNLWHLRMYIKNTRRYVAKSLHTKEQALLEERATDLYIEIRNNMELGKSFFTISIKEGVALYLEYRKQDIGIANIGIVKDIYRIIVKHLSHYLDYLNKDTKVSDLRIKTLSNYVRENEETS